MESAPRPLVVCLIVLLFVGSSASGLTDLDQDVQEQGSRDRGQRHQSATGNPDGIRPASLPAVWPDPGHSVGHRSVDSATLRKLLLLYGGKLRKQSLAKKRKQNSGAEADGDVTAAKSSGGEDGGGTKNDYSHYEDLGRGDLWGQTEADNDKHEKYSEDEDLSALTFNIAAELAEQKDLLDKIMRDNDPRNELQVMVGRNWKDGGSKSKDSSGKTTRPIPVSRNFLQDARKGKEWKGVPSLGVKYDVIIGAPKPGSNVKPKIFKIQEADVPAVEIAEEAGDVKEDDPVPREPTAFTSEGRSFVGKADGSHQASRVADDDIGRVSGDGTTQVGEVATKRLQQPGSTIIQTAVTSGPPPLNGQMRTRPAEMKGEFKNSATIAQASPSREPDGQRETTPATEAAARLPATSLERSAWISVESDVWPTDTGMDSPTTTAREHILLKSNSSTNSERLTPKDKTGTSEQLPPKSNAAATSQQVPLKNDITATSEQQPLKNDAIITNKNQQPKNDATATSGHQLLKSDSKRSNSSDAGSLFNVFSSGGSRDAVQYAMIMAAPVVAVILIVCCMLLMCKTRCCRSRRRPMTLQMTEESLTKLNTYPPLYVSISPLRKPSRPGQHYLLSILDKSDLSVAGGEDSSEEEVFNVSKIHKADTSGPLAKLPWTKQSAPY